MLAKLDFKKKGFSTIVIKTNQTDILEDVFKYAHHVNNTLKNDYIFKTKKRIKNIKFSFKTLDSEAVIKTLLRFENYVFF